MIALKLYSPIEEVGGPGDPVAPPKGYKTTNAKQRSDWNGFLDYAKNKPVDLDKDPKAGIALLSQYNKENKGSTLTPDLIPHIQYEQQLLRKGDSFPTLNANELKYVRSGFSPAYANMPVSEVNGQFNSTTSKLYYPQGVKGGKNYGTDIEGYAKALTGGPQTSTVAPLAPITNGNPAYANHDAALKRVTQLASMPGNEFLHGRGDALINANYIPNTDNKSFRDSSLQAAKKVGLDPAMFWSSAAEEGATGLIPDKNGKVNTGDESHVDLNGKYPVDGFTNFGLDHFHDRFKELVQKGYLPKDFDYQKATIKNPENGETVNSGNFKSVEDALSAKAAFVRMEKDHLDEWQNTNKVKLSPTANQFFTFIAYNGGPGTAHKLINYYKSKGLLEGDKFLNEPPPKSIDPGGSFSKVQPRYKVANLLKQEKVLE